jgi:peptide/nickel transport system permease protein
MAAFLLRRALLGVVTLLVVASATFALLHAAPGEPFGQMLEDPRTTPELRQRIRERYGLDQSIPRQYLRYVSGLARGDLGDSYDKRRPVRTLLAERLPRTMLLMGTALMLGFALGILLGTWQAARAGSPGDRWVERATVALGAVPDFWIALTLLLLFGLRLRWFPVGGMTEPITHDYMSLAGQVMDVARHLVLPATALALLVMAMVARHQRAALLDTLPEDHIRTARAKGVPQAQVIRRHALRTALLPTITLFGLTLPALVGGAVLVESTFSWPGMGQLAVESIAARDYPVVLGVTLTASALVVVGGIVSDLLMTRADPRTRRG